MAEQDRVVTVIYDTIANTVKSVEFAQRFDRFFQGGNVASTYCNTVFSERSGQEPSGNIIFDFSTLDTVVEKKSAEK